MQRGAQDLLSPQQPGWWPVHVRVQEQLTSCVSLKPKGFGFVFVLYKLRTTVTFLCKGPEVRKRNSKEDVVGEAWAVSTGSRRVQGLSEKASSF